MTRAAIACLVAVVVVSCAKPSTTPLVDVFDPDGVMVESTSEPATIDPQLVSFPVELAVVDRVFESLLTFDPVTLRPAPAAAELPKISADGLVYHFTLRPGLTYSDGLSVKASDFAYGIGRLCDPKVPSFYRQWVLVINGCEKWSTLDAVKAPADELVAARRSLFATGIVVLGDRDLEFRLREPAAYLSSVLALWLAVPVRQSEVERVGENWWLDPATYIGNGPFVLVEWIRDTRMVFERNPRYRTPAKLKRWTTRVFTDQAQALSAYRSGAVDRMKEVGVSILPDVKAAGLDSDISVDPGSCHNYVRPNHARPPLDDPKVRLALAKSLDREAYARDVRAYSRAATSFIPAGLPGHDPLDTAQAFDLTAAKRALSESRYAGGDLLKQMVWPMASNATAINRRTADWVAGQWRALGIDVRIEVMDPVALAELNRSLKTRSMFAFTGWCADYPDQQDWFSGFFTTSAQSGPGQRDVGYRNSTVDALLAEADRGTDPGKRDELYLRASRIVSAEVGYIWLAYFQNATLNKPWIGGLNPTAISAGGVLRPTDVFVRRH